MIDPVVVAATAGSISSPRAAPAQVVTDGRLLARARRAYDLIILDAFGSDAIPSTW
jgi:hypothetical protein